MLFQILALWGCMPEITKDCVDMTNASSTYLSIALGAIVGAVISWWIYNMQKKTSVKQDETLRRINKLEESHDKVLKSIWLLDVNGIKNDVTYFQQYFTIWRSKSFANLTFSGYTIMIFSLFPPNL
jgi:hypothetical protein